MSQIERYRTWYEHERDCNSKMIAMIESVPADRRDDSALARAVGLAAHLAACRENWLDTMTGSGRNQGDWFPDNSQLESLRPRFSAIETKWTNYLNTLSDDDLGRDFEFAGSDGS